MKGPSHLSLTGTAWNSEETLFLDAGEVYDGATLFDGNGHLLAGRLQMRRERHAVHLLVLKRVRLVLSGENNDDGSPSRFMYSHLE